MPIYNFSPTVWDYDLEDTFTGEKIYSTDPYFAIWLYKNTNWLDYNVFLLEDAQ